MAEGHLEKQDSPDKVSTWLNGRGYDSHVYIDEHHGTCFTGCHIRSKKYSEYGTIKDLPEKVLADQSGNGSYIHDFEEGYWLTREAYRFYLNEYKPAFFRAWLKKQGEDTYNRYWWHFVHQSLDDHTMVAYTPNHQYGKQDRQVKVKIGKYLKQFYGDVFDDTQIREIANLSKDFKIEFRFGSEAIHAVYNHKNAPHSCMVGDEATKCYGYQYPDGTYEFAIAVFEAAGVITARAIVAPRVMKYVRLYGDNGPIMESKLTELGYERIQDMTPHKLRLLYLGDDYNPCMPYLDGQDDDARKVNGPHTDEAGVKYWEWAYSSEHPTYTADNPDGYLRDNDDDYDDEDRRTCYECSNSFDVDDMNYSEHVEEHICDNCCSNHYTYAQTHYGETYVHNNDVIECQSDSNYYLDHYRTLEEHNIVKSVSGDYWSHDDVVELLSGGYGHPDEEDALIVACGEDEYGDTQYILRTRVTERWIGVRLKAMEDGHIHWFHPQYIPDWAQEPEKLTDADGVEYQTEDEYIRKDILAWLAEDESKEIEDELIQLAGMINVNAWKAQLLPPLTPVTNEPVELLP